MSRCGNGSYSKIRLKWNCKVGNENTNKVKEEKDLGVIIQDNTSPERYSKKVNEDMHGCLEYEFFLTIWIRKS